MNKFLLFTLSFVLPAICSQAQEICDNNIDDDNDGFIDFGDCDCENKLGNIWHFSTGFGVDFNNIPPTSFTSSIATFEGSSSICDEDGNLLFYSNGGQSFPNSGIIWDRNGDVMYEMTDMEGGGNSAINSCVIVKKPNSTTNYYMFTMADIESGTNGLGLSYFEIDMSANGGLGQVVLTGQSLHAPAFEILAAVEHDNGEDYWVIIRDRNSRGRDFLVFAATESGVAQTGTYSFPITEPDSNRYEKIKISPDRRRIGEWSNQNLAFMDFDPSTGAMSNRVQLPQEDIRGGDFSPSGRYFYFEQRPSILNNTLTITRVDLNTFPASAPEMIGSYTPTSVNSSAFKLGPQEAIYFLNRPFWGSIQCSDSPSPGLEPQTVSPPPNFSGNFIELPTYPSHYFFRPFIPLEITGQSEYEICGGQPVTLSIQTSKCADILWNTGSTANETVVTTPGTYTVTATDDCEQAIFEIIVTEGVPAVEISGPTEVCSNELVRLTPINLPPNTTISWQNLNGDLLSTDANLEFTATQDTTLIADFALECGTTQTTVDIEVNDTPMIDLNITNPECIGDNGSVSLINPNANWIIEWRDNTGNAVGNTAEITDLAVGNYSVEVVNQEGTTVSCATTLDFAIESPNLPQILLQTTAATCGNANGSILVSASNNMPISISLNGQVSEQNQLNDLIPNDYSLQVSAENGCILVDSIVSVPDSTPQVFGDSLSFAGFQNQPLSLNLGLEDVPNLNVAWSPKIGLSCTDCIAPTASLEEDINYQVTVMDTITGCAGVYNVSVVIRPEEKVFIPNAFSPNGDGINDDFQAFPSDPQVLILSIKIFNQWGGLVFDQAGTDLMWDGTIEGTALPTGIYVYTVEVQYSTGVELLSGEVVLIR